MMWFGRCRSLIGQNSYLILNGFFLSGIIFIGTQVLLSVTWVTAVLLSIATFAAYESIVAGAHRLISSLLSVRLIIKHAGSRQTWTIAASIATIASFATIPYAILIDFAITGTISSARYYFYACVMAAIVFITTALNFLRDRGPAVTGLETLKAQFSLSLELIRSLLWIFAFTIFGTAYAQVLTTSGTFSAGEMILIFYTFVGIIGFVFVPVAQTTFGVMDEINKQESTERP
jgi:hypothetical protein